MATTYDVIVIGAGINGLTAAAQLARGGRKVLVLEARAALGGSAASEELAPGFRIDPCTHDTGWISPTLVRELDLQKHGLVLLPRDPAVLAPSVEGQTFTLWRDQPRAIESIRSQSVNDAAKWPAFAARMKRFASFLESLYTVHAPRPGGGFKDLMELAIVGKRMRGLGKADMVELLRVMPMSVAELLDDHFESDLLKGTVGAGGITGIQQGPRSGGTSFVLLHRHVGGDLGAFRMRLRPRGGSGALTDALASSARAAGVEIRTGVRVARVRITNGRADGVVSSTGDEIAATRVVSSADPRTTLLGLVSAVHLDPELVREVDNVRFRGVTARIHLGLGELPRFRGQDAQSEAMRGVISINPNLDYLEHAYDDAKHGRVSSNPFLEITIPSLADPSVAPAGKHVMSISMQYAPYKLGDGAWTKKRGEELGDAVIKQLAEYAPNLPAVIEHRRVLTPLDLETDYGLPEGDIEHGELGLDQILFMRPVAGYSRYRTPIEGLYLCGAGTHPGRAVAGAGGRLAAQTVLKEK